jgi:flagellar biosynthesis/type III secretory pathway protein FliH
MPKWDQGRTAADKILEQTEKRMGRIYSEDPALVKIQKRLAKYLDGVRKDTQELYEERKAHPMDEDARKAYEDAIREKTLGSKEYNAIIKEFVQAITAANQKALDVANGTMVDVYTVSYNNVAEECRRVGIKVHGKE